MTQNQSESRTIKCSICNKLIFKNQKDTHNITYHDEHQKILKHLRKTKENPRSRFRQLYQIKDSHGRVHSIVGGLKLAKTHAQRYADMFDETMRIELYKWRG